METGNSSSRVFLITLAIIMLSSTVFSQAITKGPDITATSNQQKLKENDTVHRIKGTRRLPIVVRKAFNNSRYSTWFIEKIISHSRDDKKLYTFYLNNSSLLDGDHYDHLLKKSTITVSDDGTIIQASNSDQF